MSRHVVFGAGQVGRPLVERLLADGHDVVAVSRNGRGPLPGAEVVGGDATDPAFTSRVCLGADAVYFCLNAPDYRRWDEEFPPLQRAVLAGATHADARLVVLDNLYSYGPPDGRPLVETMAAKPTSRKSATRAAMTEDLLRAHASGRVAVAIGRASDYFGPGARRSALGETVFANALSGRRAQVLGDPDQPHSYSYTPDVAAALLVLGTAAGATGQIWHLPVAPAHTTREIIERLYTAGGHRPRILAASRATLRALGLVRPAMREYLHTLYQFTDPWVVDDSKFRTAFGVSATPLDEALDATLAWYGATASAPAIA
ncbi:NAD-dependent epimerase/dehydratase family protein [Xylanimonas ulmi]|uniref:Nucleoside-diphosphate-sugar epimerase n=1 Tax=Xylanimonas ulmi TaxID=228973 RepID=A0A4Q7M1T5_9MICO|nr:NAD-dependent epimerase/dehydratase family protein [Xylanibacterium ulmi]RZS60767.1 nucleoside-diphosphate-sugar epimerase [Xylanibacterium ulmi]